MVFCFTATGNSLYVAKCIDEYPVSIPQVIKNSSIYSDNQIGIVCPVYCGEIPNTVKAFLKKSKFDTKYMYLILTYGNSASDCPEFTYNEFKALGINFDYIDTVHCVDNYLPAFDMAEEKNQIFRIGEKAMNNFVFENSSRVYFGEGCVKEYLSNILSAYGDTVMLCYGGGSIKKNGIYDEVLTVLKKENKAVVEFSGIESNPTYSKVLEGVKLAKESNADLILAVGGGSVMDCCKAISLGAKYDGDIWENFWARPGVIDFEPLPLGIIVTVSGTGSECNGGAVITNEELKIKTGRDYPQLNAKFVMLDPTYTYSVPKFQMVSGAFDTLSHIMEIYFSEPNESNVSDDISEALMKNVIANLRAAIKNPEDYTARSNLMWDATMAENRIIKLGKKTDFECHQMEHQLGAYTNCNHGAGLAVLHPVYYRHICKAGEKKFAQFATNVWGISKNGKTDEELAKAGVEALADFIKEIGMPTTFKELGIDENINLKEIADSCGIVPGAYKKMTHEEILKIFEECK